MTSLSEGPQIFLNPIPMNYKFMFLSFPPLSASSTLLPSESHTGFLVLWRGSRAERAVPISIGKKAGAEKKNGRPRPNQDQATEHVRIWEEGDLQMTYKELHSVLDLLPASLPPLEGPFISVQNLC